MHNFRTVTNDINCKYSIILYLKIQSHQSCVMKGLWCYQCHLLILRHIITLGYHNNNTSINTLPDNVIRGSLWPSGTLRLC